MNWPNLFIIGAPKCGTTSLAQYLSAHPGIYFSPIKEPHYFTFDMPGLREATDQASYQRLFSGAQSSAIYRGEASVFYLYSQAAVPNILQCSPNARLIVMVRNPIAMVQSLYAQQRLALAEDAPDFATAWRWQEERLDGKHRPPLCAEPGMLQYRQVAQLGAQVERLFATTSPEQRHVIVYDDFASDPARAYAGALRFLGLQPDGRTVFPKVNARSEVRSYWLQWMLYRRRWPASLRWAGRHVGLHKVYELLRSLNMRQADKRVLAHDLLEELRTTFRDDVGRLSSLLGRDLSSWMAN